VFSAIEPTVSRPFRRFEAGLRSMHRTMHEIGDRRYRTPRRIRRIRRDSDPRALTAGRIGPGRIRTARTIAPRAGLAHGNQTTQALPATNSNQKHRGPTVPRASTDAKRPSSGSSGRERFVQDL
jgi:hypothetical protein